MCPCEYVLHWSSSPWEGDQAYQAVSNILYVMTVTPLQWRHNERDGVWNHQPHECLPNRLIMRKSKKTSKLRVTAFCEGNSAYFMHVVFSLSVTCNSLHGLQEPLNGKNIKYRIYSGTQNERCGRISRTQSWRLEICNNTRPWMSRGVWWDKLLAHGHLITVYVIICQ